LIKSYKMNLLICALLLVATSAVFRQVSQCGFVFDDYIYIVENIHIQSGLTLKGMIWAFTTRYADLWNPLVWISFMIDHRLYGMNAGGYHITNLVFHLLTTLLLFWIFQRMTGAVWKSAFVAAFFALHPLHVESVAWVAERKDTLSAFFWVMTLCLYVLYTEKKSVQRYLPVLFAFILALLSKPMVITLPVMMILLDYWPLGRFRAGTDTRRLIRWQLKEKLPFLVLSLVLVMVTFYAPGEQDSFSRPIPLGARLANAPVALVMYLAKTFWPQKMAIFYPFVEHLPIWKVAGATLLIVMITVFVILMAKRLPPLFTGWMWFLITIAPVSGIIQISLTAPYAMADRYHYLPSIGVGLMLTWGVPLFIKNKTAGIKILSSTAILVLITLAAISWKQCGYWKNPFTLFEHALRVTENNHMAHHHIGFAFLSAGDNEKAMIHLDKAIQLNPHDFVSYCNRGNALINIRKHPEAIKDYQQAITINPRYAPAYINRGNAYNELGQYDLAIQDFNRAILLKPEYYEIYNNRGTVFSKLNQHQKAIDDFSQAIRLNQSYATAYSNRGTMYMRSGQYALALQDFNDAIEHKVDYADAYHNRALVYLNIGDIKSCCRDAQKACELGNCTVLQAAVSRGLCN